ncbi:hypothetical protein DV738_g481, partial [Chaetothyriales sp. CBS 135597]
MGSLDIPQYDVLIIGAGLSGICSLHHIRERFPSWRVRLLEAGSDVGGTWYWNRYPGARFDSESVTYAFSWDKELLNEWHWTEVFASQPETLRYIQHVARKHGLYKHIQFNTRVVSATWEADDQAHTWTFVDDAGARYRTTFFVSCLGFLSSPTLPDIPGIESFAGPAFHTSRWPKDFDLGKLADKRVGVIGTGSTGIQIITELATTTAIKPPLKSLTVFQRRPNWAVPLRNSPITADEMAKIRQSYDSIFQTCNETSAGLIHNTDPRKSSDVTAAERTALWNKLYSQPGFGKWLGVFSDTYTDREANRLYTDFIAAKIRARIADPALAEQLIPTDHGFGLRRVPLESGYFEVFNQPNVRLVNLARTPIAAVSADAITTADGTAHALDVLIFATGFDAVTGAFREINCASGAPPVWPDHQPRTFLGVTVPSCPNMFMVLGPHQPFGNATRCIEHAVGVVCNLLQHCHDGGYTYVEPTEAAADAWTEHVVDCSRGLLSNEVDSWVTGVNANVPGKTKRIVARYNGSTIEYRRRCEECRLSGWKGLTFQTAQTTTTTT